MPEGGLGRRPGAHMRAQRKSAAQIQESEGQEMTDQQGAQDQKTGDQKTGDAGQGAANGAEGPTAEAQDGGVLPITINAQYVRDLSVENPNAPGSLRQTGQQPNVNLNVDVQARGLEQDAYEVVLNIHAEARREGQVSFIAELSYGGVFTLTGVAEEHRNAVLLIEGPRLLFPFARSILAEVTREAGFPPLMINPIDFAELYRRQLIKRQEQQESEGGEPAAQSQESQSQESGSQESGSQAPA